MSETGRLLDAEMEAIAARRDRDAFRRVFEHYGPKVRGYIKRLGADGPMADDLMQEVMLAVWTRAHQFDRSRAALSTWIFTIARNKRIDLLRRNALPGKDWSDPSMEPPPPPRGDTALQAAETSDRIHKAIQKLPVEQAELLRKFYLEELTHTAIAEGLGLPLGTVKSRIRLGIAKLRLLLKEMEP